MKKKILHVNLMMITVLLFCISCKQSGPGSISVQAIPNTGSEAVDPYLTKDYQGNAVLCWTEKSPADSLYRLRYAVYKPESNQFGEAITVTPSAGTKSSAESMNKIAFKSDGIVIAVFARKFENQKNRFAGAILYSSSADQGKTWSEARYIHSDTSHTYGRGYFDLARMKNGEIAGIWLDGRYGKADTGSALFFASTSKGKGFENEKCIDRQTCQCCRTDLLAGNDGNLHIAYRSIMYPPKLLGQQVRDMVYTYSKDNGSTFEKIKNISKDNWAIEGCPHTGPSLANIGQNVYALWFTGGNSAGVYLNKIEGLENNFSPRELQSTTARHPQLTSLDDGRLFTVWEENASSASMEKNSHQHETAIANKEISSTKISLKILKDGKVQRNMDITNGSQADNHAVITGVNEGVLIAWVNEDKNRSGIQYSYIKADE